MVDQPTIPLKSTVLMMNDMINSNLRSPANAKAIDESGIIPNTAKLVAELRKLGVPIFWIRVERRPDRADAPEVMTDAFLASGMKSHAPVVKGSWEAANVDELPVMPEDQVILKPRFNPFLYTDLDWQLRARKIDTILLGGYSTNVGVETIARTARDMGFNVVLLSDCCYNVKRELHEFSIKNIMPMFTRVMTSQQALSLLT